MTEPTPSTDEQPRADTGAEQGAEQAAEQTAEQAERSQPGSDYGDVGGADPAEVEQA